MNSEDNFELTVQPPLSRTQNTEISKAVATPILRPANSVAAPTLLSQIEIPFVHKWLILTCTLAAMLLGWLLILVWPRTYESEGQLMIRVGRESVALDPTATTGTQTLLIQKTRNEEVISALGILSSRRVYEGVVAKIGAEHILSGFLPAEDPVAEQTKLQQLVDGIRATASNTLDVVLVTVGLRDRLSDEEMAIKQLKNSVEIFAPRESAILSVNASAKSPEMAQAISQSVIDTFVEQHMKVSRTPGSYAFFERQAREAEINVNKLITERTEFLQDKDLISVTSNQAILQEQLSVTKKQLLESEGKLRQMEAEIKDATVARDSIPKEILASKQERENSTYSGMRQKLFDLEVREMQYKQTLAPANPMMIVIRKQITEIRKILESVDAAQIDQSTTPNPARQRVEGDIQRLTTSVAGLKSMIDATRMQCEDITKQINDMAESERRLIQLDRDIALQEVSLNSLRVKLEEARVIEEMGRDKISNVSVFQPATLIERPTSPKKRPLAALFTALGIAVGLVAAYMREANSKTLRTVEHVAAGTGAEPIYAVKRNWRLKTHRGKSRKPPNDLDRACKSILSDILLTENWGGQRSVGVLGCGLGCGASSIATSLSFVSSQECGLNTILVDADGKHRTVSKAFHLNRSPGLAELAKGHADFDECVQQKETNLSLVPFSSPSSHKRLNGDFDAVVSSLNELRTQSDVLIVDLPSASDSPEAIAFARQLDHVIVVIESEKTTTSQATKLLRHLDVGQTQVIGVILNKTKQHTPQWIDYFTSGGSS